jgi:hypothetical protein
MCQGILRAMCQGGKANVADEIGLLAIFGEVESAETSTREMKRPPLSNDAVFPPLLWTGKKCKTSKSPRFTKTGQEPNGIKLSPYWPDIAKVFQCKCLNL